MRYLKLSVLLVALALVLPACSDPTTPAEPAQPPQMHPETLAYLEAIVSIMEQDALHRLSIDWSNFRSSIFHAAGTVQSKWDLLPAIRLALGLLRDNNHSYYVTSQGRFVRAEGGVSCSGPWPIPWWPELPWDIGYVKVGGFSSADTAEVVGFARAIQDSIRANDSPDLTGWVVDLRGNWGGNMWPMLAGLGPLLGEGVLGYFLDPEGERRAWTYTAGGALLVDRVLVQVDDPYQPYSPAPRVAVLMDGLVASSGEATLLSFRNRPDARLFGTPSCGLATGVRSYPLFGGSRLGLTVSWMADRTGATFDREIPPDEILYDSSTLVERAVAWLRNPDQTE